MTTEPYDEPPFADGGQDEDTIPIPDREALEDPDEDEEDGR